MRERIIKSHFVLKLNRQRQLKKYEKHQKNYIFTEKLISTQEFLLEMHQICRENMEGTR